MSIVEQIQILEDEGRLIQVTPYVASDICLRKLLLVKDLHTDVYEDKDNETEVEIFANLIADLEVFVTSETIDPKYLWCLTPKKSGVWEIRSTRPSDQIRVFGVFADKDIFICTHYKFRSQLGDLNSEQWKIEIRATKATWRNLFPGYTYKETSEIHRLITGALNEKYFR